jgi:hypothetical protein
MEQAAQQPSRPRGLSFHSNKSPQGNSVFFFRMNKGAKAWTKKYRTEIAASTSSVLSTFAAFPLDFAKSRMQSYNTTFTATVKDAYKAEGLRAFWRGVLPPMISVTVVRTISFSIYQRAKYTADDGIKRMTGKSPLALANATNSYPSIYTLACFGSAGALSGAVITLISCPFELTKLNEQLAGKILRDSEACEGSDPWRRCCHNTRNCWNERQQHEPSAAQH